MKTNPEVIAIIPARGGSKGIPRKNIVDLCGKPLIAYSIEVALQSKAITRVVVSTDDEEIAEVARSLGAETPFIRPKELSNDTAAIKDTILHSISMLGGYKTGNAYVELYPTSPFRTPKLIDEIVGILQTGYKMVTTVKNVKMRSDLLYQIKNGRLENLLENYSDRVRNRNFYRTYPLCYAHDQNNSLGNYIYEVKDKCMLIDIDTPADLNCAQKIIKNKLFNFKG